MKTIGKTLLAGFVTLVFSGATGCAALIAEQPGTEVTAPGQIPPPGWTSAAGMPQRQRCVGVATEDCYDRFPNHDALIACLEAQFGECEADRGKRVASYRALASNR